MTTVALLLAERGMTATATTAKTIPVAAARIRDLVVADIMVPMRADRGW
jgi:hypothetical protein